MLLARHILLVGAALLAACSADEEIPQFDPDYFSGRTIRFTPDKAVGGVPLWYYDLDVDGLVIESDGTTVALEVLQGCNFQRTYEAADWGFDNATATIEIDFSNGWEHYRLLTAKPEGSPYTGRFELKNSEGHTMQGDWRLGLQFDKACTLAYDISQEPPLSRIEHTASFCDCMHCPITSCAQPLANGTCCSDPKFLEP
jgi:hypothetical protein